MLRQLHCVPSFILLMHYIVIVALRYMAGITNRNRVSGFFSCNRARTNDNIVAYSDASLYYRFCPYKTVTSYYSISHLVVSELLVCTYIMCQYLHISQGCIVIDLIKGRNNGSI